MAYPYFPATYQANYNPYMTQNYQPFANAQNAPVMQQNTPQAQQNTPANTMQQNANNGLIWVQGLEGAKAHFVPAGSTVMLMDSENDRFYLKSSDMSGMPLPLRIFDYKEITQSNSMAQVQKSVDVSDFVTHEEFNELRKSIDALTEKKTKDQVNRKRDVENG